MLLVNTTTINNYTPAGFERVTTPLSSTVVVIGISLVEDTPGVGGTTPNFDKIARIESADYLCFVL